MMNLTISNIKTLAEGEDILAEGKDITFTFSEGNGEAPSMFELSEAEINIFDPDFYLANNSDVVESIASEYEDTRSSSTLINANVPNLASSGFNQIQTEGNAEVIINSESFTSNTLEFSVALKDYVETGAAEGQSPSPLFDSEYYLAQNPDVASALAGGSFNGDPLLHYVEAGAVEGRDPNAFFDSDYYLTENPGVAETSLNPLEHYVLIGSSAGADPSANFDPEYYLAENQDVFNAGVDPLTHFLTSGQAEGRSPIAI